MTKKVSLQSWIILFMLGAIWGSSFILLKIGTRYYDTIEVASLRMFFSSVLVLPFFVSIIRRFDLKTLGWMFLSAILGSGIPAIFYAYAAGHLDSNINGVINSLTPIFTLLFGIGLFGGRIGRLSVLGILIGFVGVGLLLTQHSSVGGQPQYAIYPLLASVMYGCNMNIVKLKLSRLPSQDILSGVFGFIAIIYVPLVIYLGAFDRVSFDLLDLKFWEMSDITGVQQMRSLTALAIVGLVGSLFASWTFYILVKQTSALFASVNTYLIPLMAIYLGWLDGESIGWMHGVSLVLILTGVYLVGMKQSTEQVIKST